ncbi:GNAT family N-acetyltransferase [Roseomonas sp. KE0001]|uniref:GNAT family N-acetyltransferase n=1 Tax=Roseomonas sp. KE0001 TaxID=2479201 RepID=UPI001E64F96A|nr:hypothetical protein [Roseomonas sp. KE0001]
MPEPNTAALAKQRPEVTVRPAMDADMDAVAAIYRHPVLHGTATFETEPPTTEEMRQRRAATTERGLPYLLAEGSDGRVLVTPTRAPAGLDLHVAARPSSSTLNVFQATTVLTL